MRLRTGWRTSKMAACPPKNNRRQCRLAILAVTKTLRASLGPYGREGQKSQTGTGHPRPRGGANCEVSGVWAYAAYRLLAASFRPKPIRAKPAMRVATSRAEGIDFKRLATALPTNTKLDWYRRLIVVT